jgi:hypothetical protein
MERVRQLVEGGANIDEVDEHGNTALSLANLCDHFELVVYLVKHGANVTRTDSEGATALHSACAYGNLLVVKYLLEHGSRITDRDKGGKTALLHAVEEGHLELVQYLLSSEGGSSITETDNKGNTALLLADNNLKIVQWLLEYGGAQITDTNDAGDSVWSVHGMSSLQEFLISAYTTSEEGYYVSINGEYVPKGDISALTAMLRVMVLHGGPSEALEEILPPPFQRIVQDGARLRARLPAYFVRRRALSDAHCPLLPPLKDLVHGYEEPTTTDELWATGLGAPLRRARHSRLERGQSPERRSARLRQKRL